MRRAPTSVSSNLWNIMFHSELNQIILNRITNFKGLATGAETIDAWTLLWKLMGERKKLHCYESL